MWSCSPETRAQGKQPQSARIAVKARAQELDVSVARAVEAKATDELRRLAEEIIRLPSDEPIPSTALSRACRSVVAAEGTDQCRPLLEDALDRLEIDLTHPKLSQPGRRHAAGHAALVARLLARSDEQAAPAVLDRALTSYRASFGAVNEPAYADAGACALGPARILTSGDDADAEEAVGLLHEAVDWLEKAWAKAQEPSSSVRRDFDPVVVHSRLGEAALRSYALTPTGSMLETAIKNLEASMTLEASTEEAAELARPKRDRTAIIGHLGDAYYRRGTKNRDAEDLERALALKEETYPDGNQARENRSLAAAAAERLHRITADNTQLTRSAGYALQASTCDPAWPWPMLQLADLARQHEPSTRPARPGSRPSRPKVSRAWRRPSSPGSAWLRRPVAARTPIGSRAGPRPADARTLVPAASSRERTRPGPGGSRGGRTSFARPGTVLPAGVVRRLVSA